MVGMTAKEKLRAIVEGLSEQEAVEALESLAPASSDRVLDLFDRAPADDEPSSPEEDAHAAEAWAEYERGEAVSLDEARRELG